MFSVGYQTPSADAGEIHPGRGSVEEGRAWEKGKANRREESVGFFLFSHFLLTPVSETVKAKP